MANRIKEWQLKYIFQVDLKRIFISLLKVEELKQCCHILVITHKNYKRKD